MKKCDCELCKFENPKIATAGVIIRDQKLLVARRLEEPFRGQWDFFGGWIFPRQTLPRRQAVVEDMIVDESQRGKGLGEKILLDLKDN